MSAIESIKNRSHIRPFRAISGHPARPNRTLPLIRYLREAAPTGRSGWCAVKVGVYATATDQLLVGTLFLDDAAIYRDNAVHPFKRCDPVRNKDDCLVRELLYQVCKDPSFRWGVKRRSRFIQQQ